MLVFLPKYCEKCHIDYIRESKNKEKCEFCGYPLKVKEHLDKLYEKFLIADKSTVETKRPNDKFSKDIKKFTE